MVKYVLKRILMGVLTIFILASVAFLMIRIVPGGPFDADVAEMSEEAYRNLEMKYGLDKPLYVQYAVFMTNLLHGDLGESLQYTGTSVADLIGRGIGATARLATCALIFSVAVGLALGISASLRPDSGLDRFCTALSTIGVSLPNYVVAIALMYVFAQKLQWVPVTGLDSYKSYFLPVIALSLNPIAHLTKLSKTSMIDALNQDYVVLARAKGMRPGRVVCLHALKNALLPVITYIGPLISSLMIGSFVVENMFTIPGIGKMLATSITMRDYTTLTGMVIFYGTTVIVIGIIVDLVYVLIDPRVKYE